MLDYFLRRRESSPQAAPCTAHEDATEEDMFEILCKLVLYAPEIWYSVSSGQQRPEDAKNNWASIGVAFDASSRLRRAGIEYYHGKLTDQWSDAYDKTQAIYIGAGRTSGEITAQNDLPMKLSCVVRIVAVSDTHLLHRHLQLPPGDLLVHAGDLAYEESRAPDSQRFEEYMRTKGSTDQLEQCFESSGMDLVDVFKWLQDAPGFEHRVIIGGNHDYILECMGKENSRKVCKHFGLDYLSTDDAPLPLKFSSGPELRVWGSPISMSAELDATRVVKSGNSSFQLPKSEAEVFLRDCKHITSKSVDIMVTHGPPEGILLGKEGKTLPAIKEKVLEVQPMLYICGHAHNEKDLLHQRWAEIGATLGVNAACLSNWNHFHGLPIVIDRAVV